VDFGDERRTAAPPGALPQSTLLRLEGQLQALPTILGDAAPESFDVRPQSGEWSARENLAHLARHAEVFLSRLDRILHEDRPQLGAYRAERDSEWPAWAELPLEEVLRRLGSVRARLIAWVNALPDGAAGRTGMHPTFGEISIARWLEFFVLHEAQHLYVTMIRLGEAERRRR
jgi:DinB family protein